MEFKHLNQPDFDRERDGAIEGILGREWWREAFPSITDFARQAYNEGFKAALRMIQKEYWNPDIPDTIFEELLEEFDNNDKSFKP